MEKIDYKKEYKDLYLPKTNPMLIDVPSMKFIMVEGTGNPNDKDGEYQKAMQILYGLSFTIKMSKMGENKIDGYFEYVVPPLEGLCVQVMHLGSYDDEPETIKKIEEYIQENNLKNYIGRVLEDGLIRQHHEIYLSDPRRVEKSKLKTVIRYPVMKEE